MSRDEQNIIAFFKSQARAVTPPGMEPIVHIEFMPALISVETIQELTRCLSPAEAKQANTIRHQRARDSFIFRRAFRRYCGWKALGATGPLAAIDFDDAEFGPPTLSGYPDLSFSFSSSARGLLAACSRDHCIGVDIEDPSRTVEPLALAVRFFTDAEAALVGAQRGAQRQAAFFSLWTLKEAGLKSTGNGLGFGLEKISFELEPEVVVRTAPAQFGGAKKFTAALLSGTDGVGAVVIRNPAH